MGGGGGDRERGRIGADLCSPVTFQSRETEVLETSGCLRVRCLFFIFVRGQVAPQLLGHVGKERCSTQVFNCVPSPLGYLVLKLCLRRPRHRTRTLAMSETCDPDIRTVEDYNGKSTIGRGWG